MKRPAYLTLLLSILTGVACTMPQMTVPPEVAKDADVIAATDRSSATGMLVDEGFKLGKLTIDDVDRDWDSTSSIGVLAFSKEKSSGGYSFTLKGKDVDTKGGCVTEGSSKSMSFGGGVSMGKETAKLGCTCGGEAEAIKVIVESSTTKKYEGTLNTHDNQYKVTAIYEAEGMMSNGMPTGYRLDTEAGQARGAVEVLKPGRVWFPKDMDDAERNQIACLYVGLMLYMPPDDH